MGVLRNAFSQVSLEFELSIYLKTAVYSLTLFILTSLFVFSLGAFLSLINKEVKLSTGKTSLKSVSHDLITSVWVILIYPVFDRLVALTIMPADYMREKLNYPQWSEFSWLYVLLFLFFWDTYFWGIHIVLHKLKALKFIHKRHHIRHEPNVFTSYSFSLTEIFIYRLFWQILALPFLTLHEFFLTQMIVMVINIYGHSGFDFFSVSARLKALEIKYSPITGSDIHFNHHSNKTDKNYQQYLKILPWVYKRLERF